jgi:hypothetical protein
VPHSSDLLLFLKAVVIFIFSSDSESESRVKDYGGLGIGIESTGLQAEGILGYSILCLENLEEPVILVM